jgi:hypothetical protein
MGACVITQEECIELIAKIFGGYYLVEETTCRVFFCHGMNCLEKMYSSKLVNYGSLNIHMIQPT